MVKEEKKEKVKSGIPVIVAEEDHYAIIKPVEKRKGTVKEEVIKDIKKIEEQKAVESKEPLIDIVETDIDRLIEILKQKKSMAIDEISRELNVSLERIEGWAKILEERNLVEIEYPIIGLPRLRMKEWKEQS